MSSRELGDKSLNTKFQDKKIQETKKLEQNFFSRKTYNTQKLAKENSEKFKKKQKRRNGKGKME